MKSFKEVYESVNGNLLSEVKLARIWKHFDNDNTSVGIITAFRGNYDYNQNVKRNQELANILRKNGFGYTFVDGSWVENEGTDDEITVSEDSIFVTSDKFNSQKLRKLLVDMSKIYDQDGFSFKEAGTKSKYDIIDKNGKVLDSFKNVHFNKLASIYTKLRGGNGSFVFEEIAHVHAGYAMRLLKTNEK